MTLVPSSKVFNFCQAVDLIHTTLFRHRMVLRMTNLVPVSEDGPSEHWSLLGQVPGTWSLPELFQLPWVWWNSYFILSKRLAEKHFSKIYKIKMDGIFYFNYFPTFILRKFKPKEKWTSPPQERYFLLDPLQIFIFALFISSPTYMGLTVLFEK